MKSLNLYLIILNVLNIFLFPAVTLAEPWMSISANPEGDLISQLDPKSEKTDSESKNEDEPSEKDSESAEETEIKQPTPEEIARLNKLATADQLYLAGYKADAVKLYREAKADWEIETQNTNPTDKEILVLFDDPAQLSPAGKVFWRNYQEGKKQQLETKVLTSLKLLTTREPQFIDGHIHYAQMLKKYERPEESTKALSRAVNRYPNEPKLLQAKMDDDIAAEKWLDASIRARQFALFNPDLPQAEEFDRLADQYLAEYQNKLRSNITWNAIGNAIAGTVGFALTGSLFGPLSALETTSLLLKGESAVGVASVKQIKKQLPLIEDEKVVQYVNEIGQKIAAVSGRDEFDYQFYLVMDDQLNAFALPGGKVFINAGAIMKTDSEAELAGLLAHEVAHAALSHGFQLVTKGNLTANIVSHIPYVGNTASSLIVLNYSRTMEKQADVFGTRILVNSGYAADGVRNLMVKLHESHQDEDHPEPPAWVSSHPNTTQRVKYMEKLIVDNNLNRYTYEGVARHQEIKHLVTTQWQEYDQCIEEEEVNDIEGAKKCAGNLELAEKPGEEVESRK